MGERNSEHAMKPGSELKKWVGTYSTKGGAEMITGEFQIDHYGWDFCKSFPLLGTERVNLGLGMGLVLVATLIHWYTFS